MIRYLTTDMPFPRGEILARSPRMHGGGYFKRQRKQTDPGTGGDGEGAAAEDEDFVVLGGLRYFRTGDVGELVGPGEVSLQRTCR